MEKKAQEIIFPRKTMKPVLSAVQFNDTPVTCANQKYLGLFLDEKLYFSQHIKEKLGKAMREINVIKKLNNVLPRPSLTTIYKSFVKSHQDYGDMNNLTIIDFTKTLKVCNIILSLL